MPDPRVLRWLPRIAGVLFALVLSLFALDALQQAASEPMGLLMHLLPALFVIALVALAWRREWIGALSFLALALLYAWWARDHWSWVIGIAGPMLLIGALNGWAWFARRRQRDR